MTPRCADACIICDINGFSGRNVGPGGPFDAPPNFCAQVLHNLQWIGFIAGTPDLTLNVAVSNCVRTSGTRGLQMGVFEVIDCNLSAGRRVSTCDNDVRPGEIANLVNTEPLVVGQYYYLIIDGNNGDVCDYAVTVANGTTAVPPVTQGGGITGPAVACINRPTNFTTSPVPGAPNHYWTVDGTPQPGSGRTRTFTFATPGTHQVCVTASNTCSTSPPQCQLVTVSAIPRTTVQASICGSSCYTFNGFPLCNAGTYTATLISAAGCDSVVTLTLTQAPALRATVNTSACVGTTVQVRGQPYGPGNYNVTRPGPPGGCDTTLTINVQALQPSSSAISAAICTNQSYTFGTSTLNTSGTYTRTLPNRTGCDSTITLTLTVNPASTNTSNRTVCFGQTATIGTEIFSASGTYTRTIQTAAGCDSTVTLNLTVLPQLTASRTATICQGSTYRLGGQTFATGGNYTVSFAGPAGCDSTVMLTLNLRQPSTSTTTASICPNNSYSFGGNTYSNPGTYTVRLTNRAGCDSVATLNLSVNSTILTNEAATICNGTSFVFNGNTYTTSGSYSATLPSAAGCDSIHTLNLTVRPPAGNNRVETVCFGGSASIGSEVFTSSGTYTRTLPSRNGCDSTVMLNLTVRPAAVSTRSYRICEGTSVRVGPQLYRDAGSYTINFPGPNGCDSTVNLTLAVDLVSIVSPNVTICAGDSYQLGTQTLTTSGNYSARLQAANGCDSIVNLTLNVASQIQETVRATVCSGQSYRFNGLDYGVAGTYAVQLTSVRGCDSIVTLILRVDASTSATLNRSICQGQSVTVGSQTFAATGTYTVTLASASGCDSLVTLNLTVGRPTTASIDTTICTGQFYQIAGQALVTAGTYNFTLTNRAGCDSMVNLRLRVATPSLTNLNARFCTGTSYTFNGQTLTQGGTYSALLRGRAGCDSVVQLMLFEESVLTTTLNETICAGETYLFDGRPLTAAGQYSQTYSTAAGCDSVVTLQLSVVTGLSNTLNVTRCAGESYVFNGVARTATGVYTANLLSVSGCDSVVTLNLTVLPQLRTALRDTICAGESVTVGSQSFTTSGRHTVTLTGRGGCDSVVTLDLRVLRNASVAVQRTICAGGSVTVGSQTFTAAGVYTVPLQTPAGCDSTVILTLSVGQEVSFSERRDLCAGQNTTYRGVVYARSGTYNLSFAGASGACDTLVELIVAVAPPLSSTSSASICAGQTFTLGTQQLTQTGRYNETMTSVGGCDSLVALDLTVTPVRDTAFAKTLCAGATETFGTRTLSTSGVYTQNLLTREGCDSLVTLNLTIRPAIPATQIRRTICAGGLVTVAGQVFSASGTYDIPLQTRNGCDSLVVLELSVGTAVSLDTTVALCPGQTIRYRGVDYTTAGDFQLTVPGRGGDCDTLVSLRVTGVQQVETAVAKTICAGAQEVFGNQTLTTSGVYTRQLTAASGCDSLVRLTLTVREPLASQQQATICAGTKFFFGGDSLSRADTYIQTLTSRSGCDSIVTLVLRVSPVFRIATTASICSGSSYTFGNQTLSAAGTYERRLTSASGCDSIRVLTLNIRDSIVVNLSQTICAGESIDFGGQTLAATGDYRTRGRASSGCDSVTLLRLAVVDTIITDLDESICAGSSFTFGTAQLADAGMYQRLLPSARGCDSLVRLQLIVNPTFANSAAAEICAGQTFRFGDRTLTRAGTYTERLTSSRGCDSTLTLELTVVDTLRRNLAAEVCAGSTYTFGGQTLSTPGIYRQAGTASTGCDSVTTLTLSVVNEVQTSRFDTLCAGGQIDFGGQTRTSTGNYTERLTSLGGCDSVVTLRLTVREPITGLFETTLCAGETLGYAGQTFSAPGDYAVTLSSTTGCDSVVTLRISPLVCGVPLAGVTFNTSCFGADDGAAELNLSSLTPPLRILWESVDGAVVDSITLTTVPTEPYRVGGLVAGQYEFKVIDEAGQVSMLTLDVGSPAALVTTATWLDRGAGYALRCAGDNDAEATIEVRGGTTPYTVVWADGTRGLRITGLAAGITMYNVTDARGCEQMGNVELFAPPPVELALDWIPINCAAPAEGGGADVAVAQGGVPPYEFELQGGEASTQTSWRGLSPGSITVVLYDALGCSVADDVFLEAPQTPKLDLGATRIMDFGDTVRLEVRASTPLDSVLWTSNVASYISCDTCLTTWVAPVETTDYRVFAWAPGGCGATEEVRLIVRQRPGVYTPTAFSPNGDGVNDGFTIYTEDPDIIIESLLVFDRWGEQVWTRQELPTGRPELGWLGDYRGKAMDAAVFVYVATLRRPNGTRETIKGDVTLLR